MHPVLINSFSKGIRDGIPIALGYLSVSFAFGMTVVAKGLPVWVAVLISMTNLTSAGQLSGVNLIAASASYFELALTQLIINLRYALMSLSLSQKLDRNVRLADRLILSFGNTDEVFAVARSQKGEVGSRYLYGLILTPYVGWALGTFIGAAAGSLLPNAIRSALGIAIYGMFLAIVIPPSKHSCPVLWVVLIAVALSCLFRWMPGLNQISSGFAIILSTLIAAGFGAWFFPDVEEERAA